MVVRRVLPTLILIGLVVLTEQVTRITDTRYYLTQLTMTAYYGLVIMGLCLLMGYAGQISLGHAGFFAMGGYLSGLMTTYNLEALKGSSLGSMLTTLNLLVSRKDLYGDVTLSVHPWVSCILAVAFASVVAYLVGGPVLRLKGHYLAMATLGFGIIVYRVVLGSAIFGEADGFSDIPGFAVFPGVEVSGRASVRVANYYLAWGLLTLTLAGLLSLVNSRIGRALRAIHGAEDAARAMGINTPRFKLQVFVLSAALAALAGVLLTHFNGAIGPAQASVMASVRYVAIVAVGGMASLWGTLTMGSVLNMLSLRGYFGSLDDAVFGGILIVIMLFAPDGLLRAHPLARIRSLLRGTEEG